VRLAEGKYDLGIIDARGAIQTVTLPSEVDLFSTAHYAQGLYAGTPGQRWRRCGHTIIWDEEPIKSDLYAVEEFYGGLSFKHVLSGGGGKFKRRGPFVNPNLPPNYYESPGSPIDVASLQEEGVQPRRRDLTALKHSWKPKNFIGVIHPSGQVDLRATQEPWDVSHVVYWPQCEFYPGGRCFRYFNAGQNWIMFDAAPTKSDYFAVENALAREGQEIVRMSIGFGAKKQPKDRLVDTLKESLVDGLLTEAATYLTKAQVLARMRRGDLPTQGGGYTSALFFDDGARTTGTLGHQLVRTGVIDRPAKTSVHSRYTLATRDAQDALVEALLTETTIPLTAQYHLTDETPRGYEESPQFGITNTTTGERIGYVSLYTYEGIGKTIADVRLWEFAEKPERSARGQGLGRTMLRVFAQKYGKISSDPQGSTSDLAVRMWQAVGAHRVPTTKNLKGYFYQLTA
jgi:hypothetical protein